MTECSSIDTGSDTKVELSIEDRLKGVEYIIGLVDARRTNTLKNLEDDPTREENVFAFLPDNVAELNLCVEPTKGNGRPELVSIQTTNPRKARQKGRWKPRMGFVIWTNEDLLQYREELKDSI